MESVPNITESISKATNLLKEDVKESAKSKDNFAEVKKEVTKLKESIFNKLNSKIGFIGKAISDKFANTAKDMSDAWEKVGRKLADLSKDDVKQKEYLIKDILDKERTEELIVRNRDLSGVDFSDKNLNKVSFYDCNLTGAKFINANLNEISFYNTKVEHSNFDNAVINKIATHNAYFRGSNFNNAEIIGGEFEDKSRKSLLKRAFFTNSSMKNLTCNGVEMFMTDLNSVDLSGAKFNDNNLYEVNFNGSFMPEIINNTNFTKCDFRNTGEINIIDDLETKKEISVEEINSKNELIEKENISNMIQEEIKNQDFFAAYMCVRNKGDFDELDFMKEVVKEHGANGDIIQKAVQVVSNIKDQSPEFMSKLLNDTLKTDEYKIAFNREQVKTKDNAR